MFYFTLHTVLVTCASQCLPEAGINYTHNNSIRRDVNTFQNYAMRHHMALRALYPLTTPSSRTRQTSINQELTDSPTKKCSLN